MTAPFTPSAPLTVPQQASLWRMAWRQLARDFRAGELRLLVVAVTLAVAALTAVGFFADRLDSGLTRNAHQLLGGDAVVASDQPAPASFAAQARSLGLRVALSASFPSMARAPSAQGGASRLVAVKAVSDAYPLRGALQLASSPGAAEQTVTAAPATGHVWVDAAVLDALALKVGDELLLGDAALRIERLIVLEPDRGTGFVNFSPRVMLNLADLPATGLVQPASRISHRLAVATSSSAPAASAAAAVRAFNTWVDAQIKSQQLRGVRLESLETGRPEMRQTLDRASQFLNLVALLAALLAAVAVAVASRDFASRHLDDCAMLRVLGMAQRRIVLQYLLAFAWAGLLASVLGVALGFAVHFVFVALLGGLAAPAAGALPAASVQPALLGLGIGASLLLAFGVPPVLQLAQVPPLRVIRRDVGTPKAASLAVLAAGATGFAALLLAVTPDLKLGLLAVGGFAAATAVFAAAAWAAVQLLRRVVPETRAPRWLVLATRQISARPAFVVLQVSALSIGLLALVLLVLLRTDLIAAWRAATPPEAPNRFVINIQPEQGDAFKAHLQAAGVQQFDWYPMSRGRLVAVNGRSVSADSQTEERAKRLIEREFNLGHAAVLPPYNKLVAGAWRNDEPGVLSVEEGLAKTLGLHLGDVLRFDIGGQAVEGRIGSLRKVDWASMRVNFFAMFTTAASGDMPVSYIAAFRAPPRKNFDNALTSEFPNITSVDVSASIAQLQRVLDQVVTAVEFLFGFTLLAGLVVLFAVLSATRETRVREFAIMRALGAGSRLLGQVQRAELLGVGALAGVLASVAAMAIGWMLAREVFEFSWNPSPLVPLAGGAAGALLALSAGWWSLREVLRRPVAETLRRAPS